jgi:ABC-2 type transport system ATP-binding protein
VTAIVVDGLRKSYGEIEAVRGISFNVEEGEVFGLLGPNGAGKTTTIEILEGYRARDAGNVTVLGVDPHSGGRKLRERVGLVLQEAAVPPMLSVTELVELYRGYYPAPRPAAEIIELVGLTEKAGERVRKLSGGQQRWAWWATRSSSFSTSRRRASILRRVARPGRSCATCGLLARRSC